MKVLKVDTSTSSYLLASSVQCIALFSLRELASTCRCIQTLGMIRSVIINPHISFHKTTTIPTYQGISIVFPRYITIQHPPLHDLIFMSYMFLLHLQRHTLHTS